MRLTQRASERVLGRRNGDQMDVVGHQAVCPDVEPLFVGLAGEDTHVGSIVPVREEDLHPSRAALNDVMREIADDDPG